MSLQALIEKMKNRCLKTHSKMPVFASDEILKLCEAAEVLKRFAESIKTPHPASDLDWMLAKSALENADSIVGISHECVSASE